MSGRMTSPRTDGEQGRDNLRILVAGLRMTCVIRRAEELFEPDVVFYHSDSADDNLNGFESGFRNVGGTTGECILQSLVPLFADRSKQGEGFFCFQVKI
jgi:hypothetical protein